MTEDHEDKDAIDKLVKAFFNSFTNKGGAKPDLEGIYRLFIPEGIIIKNSGAEPEVYNLNSFIEPREKLLNDGQLVDFSEEELTERTDIFGAIAQRFCLYRKSGTLNGEKFETRGMKSIQLIKTTNGWKISAVAWDDE